MNIENKFNNYNNFLFYLLPISLIFSSFVSNFIILNIAILGGYYLFKYKNYKYFLNIYVYLFIIFCVLISITSVISDHSELNSLKSSFLLIRYLFLIIGIIYLYKFNNMLLENFFKIYLFILLILFLDSNYQYLNDGANLIGYNSYLIQHNRISSFFFDELILGSYIQKFTILYTCYFFFINKTKEKYIPFFLLISIEVCFLSGERTAFFSILLFSLIYFLFFLRSSILLKFFIVIFISIISTLIIVNNPNIKSRIFNDTLKSIQETNYKYFSVGHKNHLEIALKMYSDKPFFGYGSNKFRVVCKDYETKIGGCSTHPHNLIAQFLSEKGSMGIFFLLIFYSIVTYNFFKNLNFKNKEKKANALLYLSILFLFNPVFPGANFYNSWVNNIIFLIFSYLFILKKPEVKLFG